MDAELKAKLDACTVSVKDLLPEDEGDDIFAWGDEMDGEEATYCPDCEGVYEFGDEGYEAIVCVDCGGTNLHEIVWVNDLENK